MYQDLQGMDELTLWYGTEGNTGLHGDLYGFCKLAGINALPWIDREITPPFGLGFNSDTGLFVIQEDGIEWFCRHSVAIRKIVENWRKEHQPRILQDDLQDLVINWRKLKSYTDSSDFRYGRESCSDDLRKVLDKWNIL